MIHDPIGLPDHVLIILQKFVIKWTFALGNVFVMVSMYEFMHAPRFLHNTNQLAGNTHRFHHVS